MGGRDWEWRYASLIWAAGTGDGLMVVSYGRQGLGMGRHGSWFCRIVSSITAETSFDFADGPVAM